MSHWFCFNSDRSKNFDMNSSEKDEIPMLSVNPKQLSDEYEDSTFDKFPSWSKSVSMSARMSSTTSWHESNFIGRTSRNERPSYVQMSGPLYVKSKPENFYDAKLEVPGQQDKLLSTYKHPTNDGMSTSGLVHNTHNDKNEHLLRSGQLGMCNDPYCTTCPSYYNDRPPKGKRGKISDLYDSKVNFSFCDRSII